MLLHFVVVVLSIQYILAFSVVHPDTIATRVFETCDSNKDGFISFR